MQLDYGTYDLNDLQIVDPSASVFKKIYLFTLSEAGNIAYIVFTYV